MSSEENNHPDIIRKCYLKILEREPDEVGLKHYLSMMETDQIDENDLMMILQGSEEYKRLATRKTFTQKYDMKKNFYGKVWVGQDFIWYNEIFNQVHLLHEDFINYLKNKNNIKTILEVGCGAGVYPIKYKQLFINKKYLGIDISESAILYCKNNSNFDFLCGDFLKMKIKDKYDLVFSHAVIDHVYDISLFFQKILWTYVRNMHM